VKGDSGLDGPRAELVERVAELDEPGTELDEPGAELHGPGTELDEPGAELDEPGKELDEPGKELDEPGTELDEPGTELNEPGKELDEPGAELDEPGRELDEPGRELNEPGRELNEPGRELNEPGKAPDCGTLLCRFRVPGLEIVEGAVFAQAAEFDFGLGRVGDAGGLEEGDGLAVDGGAHGVAYGFEHEGVPGLGIEKGLDGRRMKAEEWLNGNILLPSFFCQ